MDSFNGRLLIWKSTINMIIDHPWCGYGIGGFEANYMDYQISFLQKIDSIYWKQLADDVSHPFNEYLKLIVEFGIISLIFIVYMFFRIVKISTLVTNKFEILCVEIIIVIILSSFFSYPFSYPTTWIMLGIVLGVLGKNIL